MNAVLALWLPILLSAVVVFVLSSLVHMVIKWHASEYRGFSNEDSLRDAIRAGKAAPGQYVLPYCSDMKEMGSETMMSKYKEGPVAKVMVAPNGVPNMGKMLGQWFLLNLLVSAVAAYFAVRLGGVGEIHAVRVAKIVFAVSFIAYGFGSITESIWGMRPWSYSTRYLLDAALYSIGSAAVFYWLWP